ncbi:cytochrome P450 [Streptomyces sp. T-3]|nr:cytochrome P450 [Streptomyces sp. T-3]
MEPAAPHFPFVSENGLDLPAGYRTVCPHTGSARITMPFGGQAWLFTRHADVRFIQSDRRFSRELSIKPDAPRFWEEQVLDGIGYRDAPEHTRLKRLVTKAFSGRRVQEFRPRMQAIVDRMLDELEAMAPPLDLVENFSMRVPGDGICEFMGVPDADRGRFEPFFDVIVSTTSASVEEMVKARESVEEYFTELIEQERTTPTDGLFGALVLARDEGDRLSEKELLEFGFGLILAGHETTGSLISDFVYTLLRNPDQLALLRQRPELVDGAVEELLRHTPLLTIGGVPFVASEDIEVGGVLVQAGELVIGSLEAANRDESVFQDPHRIDITRADNPHMAFSHGMHHCLGAPLARMELQLALGGLISRFPELRLAVDESELRWKPGLVVRGPVSLPVTW